MLINGDDLPLRFSDVLYMCVCLYVFTYMYVNVIASGVGAFRIHDFSLQWRHNERDCVSNYQLHDCLLSSLLGRRSKKTSKFQVTGLCAGNSPRTSNAENASIWWRHHVNLRVSLHHHSGGHDPSIKNGLALANDIAHWPQQWSERWGLSNKLLTPGTDIWISFAWHVWDMRTCLHALAAG